LDLTVDHLVIVVSDLGQAVDDYLALGFTFVPGGEHADGHTHNALIAFEDGAYIELIAFRGEPPEGHPFGRAVGWGGGLVTYALLPGNIEMVVQEARVRGLDLVGPTPGGRVRPDGVRIEWKTARAATTDLPFLCADITPRELRVPRGEYRRHENGVTGIAHIAIAVHDLGASAARYNALLGATPEATAEAEGQLAAFTLANTGIMLWEPASGPALDFLADRGDGPYAFSLRADPAAAIGLLDPGLTHGVVIEIQSEKE
jgi:catechol 2,3-dioxygenase-like lactoylglutathione lyase family enzyme